MLRLELGGEQFNKAARNRALRNMLHGRSRSSVEWKHQNVSAILDEIELSSIDGYKPRHNYQRSLRNAVLEHLAKDRSLLQMLDRVAADLPSNPAASYSETENEVPAPPPMVREGAETQLRAEPRVGFRTDYAERDAANRRLGELGEQFMLQVEQRRLKELGQSELASRVLWASREVGDGLGYDIQSFGGDGSPLHIEVKTTNLGLRHPFLISQNELRVSERLGKSYQLCRVFQFSRGPLFYRLKGAVESHCRLDPKVYLARI